MKKFLMSGLIRLQKLRAILPPSSSLRAKRIDAKQSRQNYSLDCRRAMLFAMTRNFCRLLIITFIFTHQVNSQNTDLSLWQRNSNGLLTSSNSLEKTAGLGLHIDLSDVNKWPVLMSPGGAKDLHGNLSFYDEHGDPLAIDLGQIKIPGTSLQKINQDVDWTHNKITLNDGQMDITVSRLSLAVLVNANSNSIDLFSGPTSASQIVNRKVVNTDSKLITPKYIAYYSNPSTANIRMLASSETSLSEMSNNSILIWLGSNSHFVDSKVPDIFSSANMGYLSHTAFLTHDNAFQGDIPILLTFQQKPRSIKLAANGGVNISFDGQSNKFALMPLFGKEYPTSALTESWGQSGILSGGNVNDRLNFWIKRSCYFPKKSLESYAYEPSSDTVTITNNIEFESLCSDGIKFAPLWPMLPIVADKLSVTFSSNLTSSNTHTSYGPLFGIDDASEYYYKISGLDKYISSRRIVANNSNEPAELTEKLVSQVDRIISAGHLAPWIFNDKMPVNFMLGEVYWMNMADTLYHLSEVIEVLPEPKKARLIEYMKSERNNPEYNPENIYNLKLDQGVFRDDFAITNPRYLREWGSPEPHGRTDEFLDHVPLYNFYALSKYYDAVGDDQSETLVVNAVKSLEKDLSEFDWATFSPFQKRKIPHSWIGFAERKNREAIVEQNRIFAGLIGLVRLSKESGNVQIEHTARALFAKSAITRLSLLKFPRYLYKNNFIELPSSQKWQIEKMAGKHGGSNIPNYDWSDKGGMDDTRQAVILDQFDFRLLDLRPDTFQLAPYYTAYRDMVPELFRYLSDNSKEELMIYSKKARTADPLWYMSFRPATLGSEHGLNFPIDAFQLFMTQAIVEKDSPENLQSYLDVPWLTTGDLFYTQKLAETIRAYRGWEWENGSGTPCTLKGDVDCNSGVNILDLSLVIRYFGKSSATRAEGDVSGDGFVNITDLSEVIREFGKTI